MSEKAEIGIKLTFDSNAKAELGSIVEQTKEVAKESKDTGEAMEAAFKAGLSGAVKDMFTVVGAIKVGKEAFGLIADFAMEAANAFIEDQVELKNLAGSFLQLDQNGNSLEALTGLAQDFKDQFGQAAAATGIGGSEMEAAFIDIADRGMMSVDAAAALTEEMAYASRAVPGGLAEISSGIEAIQMGMTKAKNPVVGMISSMGLLKGNAKDVAAQMAKMGLEQQMELANKAIGKMAAKMKEAPLTLQGQAASFKEASDNIMEAIGGPIVTQLTSALDHVRKYIFKPDGSNTELLDSLISAASQFATYVGNAVALVGPFVDGFSLAINDFKDAFATVSGDMTESGITMEEMKESAKLIGAIFGDLVAGFGLGIAMAVTALEAGVKAIVGVIANTMKLGGVAMQAAGMKESGASLQNAGMDLGAMANKGDQEKALAKVRSVGGGDLGTLHDDIQAKAAFAGADIDKSMDEYAAAVQARAAMQRTIDQAKIAAEGSSVSGFIEAYNAATAAHDEAAQQNILKFMAANEGIAYSLATAGPGAIEGGAKAFLENLNKAGGGKDADALKTAWAPKLGGKKDPPGATFNGGQVFNIKQDFKDQDPDRIAVVFRQDIARHATNRAQATTSPAGAF